MKRLFSHTRRKMFQKNSFGLILMEEEEEGEGREGDRRGEGTSEGWMEAILRIFSGFALEPIVTAIPPSSLLLLPLPLLLPLLTQLR